MSSENSHTHDPRSTLDERLMLLADDGIDPTTGEGAIATLAAVGRGRGEPELLRELGQALAAASELDDWLDAIEVHARRFPRLETDALLSSVEELALARRAIDRLEAVGGDELREATPVSALRAALDAALTGARVHEREQLWRYGRRAERALAELGELEPWITVTRVSLPDGDEDDVVLAWIAGTLSAAHEVEVAQRVAREGPYREAYRSQLAALVQPVEVREGGPLGPQLARTTKALVLPHRGRDRALMVRELEGGASAWSWPDEEPVIAAAGRSAIELGDAVTGPIRFPIRYEPRSSLGDAADLEVAAARCAEQAQSSDPNAVAGEAETLATLWLESGLVAQLHRIARAAQRGEVDDDDEAVVASLVAARVHLERVAAELTDNDALVAALDRLDEALGGASEATLLVDADTYDELTESVAIVPGRWWSLRAELDDAIPIGWFDALRSSQEVAARAPEPASAMDGSARTRRVIELPNRRAWSLSFDRVEPLAAAASTARTGTLAKVDLPDGGTLQLFTDRDGHLRALIASAPAAGTYALRWSAAGGEQLARLEHDGRVWMSGPLERSILAASEVIVESLEAPVER